MNEPKFKIGQTVYFYSRIEIKEKIINSLGISKVNTLIYGFREDNRVYPVPQYAEDLIFSTFEEAKEYGAEDITNQYKADLEYLNQLKKNVDQESTA